MRCLGSGKLGSLEVANVSAHTVDGVPVVLEGPAVVSALVSQLEPGHTQAFAAPVGPRVETERLEIASGDTRWAAHRGERSLFDEIRAGDLPLGRLAFAAHQRLDGHDAWTEAGRVVSLRAQEQADAWLVEAVAEHAGPAEPGPAHFRVGLRAAVFKKGGVALVKPLWLENSDPRPWRLSGGLLVLPLGHWRLRGRRRGRRSRRAQLLPSRTVLYRQQAGRLFRRDGSYRRLANVVLERRRGPNSPRLRVGVSNKIYSPVSAGRPTTFPIFGFSPRAMPTPGMMWSIAAERPRAC